MANTEWLPEAEKFVLFKNQGRAGAEAARLLEISSTNRILIDRNQAVILMVVRLGAARMRRLYPGQTNYAFATDLADMVEEHQLTINGESRRQFMQVAMANAVAMLKSLKTKVENFVGGDSQ